MDSATRHELIAPLIVLIAGTATVLGAWGFELFGGYVPCKLCLEQRIPYYIGLPFALAAVIVAFAGARPMIVRGLLLAAGLILAVNLYLAGYHAGAEWGLWEGPSDCGATGAMTEPMSAGDLLNQLNGIRIVSCSEASWRFLYLSFAGWNFVATAFLVAVALWGAVRRPAHGNAPVAFRKVRA
jgi:disulfide bond formation protein DsbB